ncbi:outer membrane beta-barrel domain-containing protein [Bdellovibrio bacteriovorus]|uniref:outer membrane beta-barrel domain-containing protein n=1 Tax=Bdellovibrio bacteriovorus TaxID=959 RepID=UPI0035A6AAB7
MILKDIKKYLLVGTIFLGAIQALAETEEVDYNDLPAESVIPILDSKLAVKSPSISFRGRFEVGIALGNVIDEMFFNNTLWGFQAFYHSDEDTAWGLKYFDRSEGLSTYSDQFANTSAQLDFKKAPSPTVILMGSHRWSFLYGKMSFTKDLVLPSTISVETDLGINKMGSQDLPIIGLGLNHTIFIKKHIGIGLAYRLLLYQTFDPTSSDLGASAPRPSESDFDKTVQISQNLEFNLSYLF